MKNLNFFKYCPSGNTTILVTEPSITSAQERIHISRQIMDPLHLGAEQVGFVNLETEIPRLDMMGGEFCGNAARCLVAYLAHNHRSSLSHKDGTFSGLISVSGTEKLLRVEAQQQDDGLFTWVQMPTGEISSFAYIGSTVHVVTMEGITHVLLGPEYIFPDKDYVAEAARIRSFLGLENQPAVGCIWYSGAINDFSIFPVVWVRDQKSTYFETACGSGTIALAMYLSRQHKQNSSWSILQPSGRSILAEVFYQSNVVTDCRIGGFVELVAHGSTYVRHYEGDKT